MKLIDIHLHIGHLFEWSKDAVKLWMDTGSYKPLIYDQQGLLIPERYLEVLYSENVYGGVLLPEYSPETAGVLPVERVFDVHRLDKRFIPFGAVNPNYHHNLLDEFKRQVDMGVKGLKVHSVHGLFFVNDKLLYPVYEYCQENKIPVMMHAGTSVFPKTKLRFADPYTFDDVAADFPELTIILCHAGRGFWYDIAMFMIKRHQNLFIDISGLPPQKLFEYYPGLTKSIDKFIFGTDFPGVPGISKNVEKIKNLGLNVDSLKSIFYRNAVNVLKFWEEGDLSEY